MTIAERWHTVRERSAAAARRSGREASAVVIVAVSKTKPIDAIHAAIAAGVTDLGENYLQEAAEKIAAIGASVRWHMIGHLQRNKAAKAALLFDVIHSVDSAVLGRSLARHAAGHGKQLRVFIEVNVANEASKSGVSLNQLEPLLAELAGESSLVVDGLMTIPPPVAHPEQARHFFAKVREMRDKLRPSAPANAPLKELSMGMTDDFEVAIEEGATIVRVGRAIFGERAAEGRGEFR